MISVCHQTVKLLTQEQLYKILTDVQVCREEAVEHLERRPAALHVSLDERRKHPVFLLQKSLGFVVLQNVPSLHHDDQVGGEDGVDTVLKHKAAATVSDVSNDAARRTLRV